MSTIASLLLLAAMGAFGIALLRRVAPHLSQLERFAYGAPIGMVLGTLAFIPLGIAGGFGTPGVAGVGLACAASAAWLSRGGTAARPAIDPGSIIRRISVLPTVVIGAFAVRWAFYWRDAIPTVNGELWAGHVNIWGDWPVHLGVVSSFAFGGNFPPEHPRFADHAFAYHYLADLTAAGPVTLGIDPASALALHSYVGCVLVAIGLYAFARRLTRRRGAATLAVVLFLLGGGLGWVATAEAVGRSGDLLGTLGELAWDRRVNSDRLDGLVNNMQVVNLFFGFMASQRAFLYGLPIAFATLSTLLVAVRARRTGPFVLAGAIAGLLPLAHLATLLAFAILIPALFLAFPSRRWIAFGLTAAVVALPQLLSQLGGSVGALSSIRLELGWVAYPDAWPVFWLKNLGVGAAFLLLGLLVRGIVPERSRRFLGAFSAIFVVVNVVAFQPWSWDNHKILVYWLLAAAILSAGAITWLWRRWRGRRWRAAISRGVLVVAVGSMLLSGALEDLGTALGQSRYRMLDAQQVELAALVREHTPPDALFVVGMRNHDPVAMLTGRRIFVGYANWLWTEGIPYPPRTAIAERIYADPAARGALMTENAIDFVVVGPYERKELGADEASFRARYPVVVETDDWAVFDVRGARAAP